MYSNKQPISVKERIAQHERQGTLIVPMQPKQAVSHSTKIPSIPYCKEITGKEADKLAKRLQTGKVSALDIIKPILTDYKQKNVTDEIRRKKQFLVKVLLALLQQVNDKELPLAAFSNALYVSLYLNSLLEASKKELSPQESETIHQLINTLFGSGALDRKNHKTEYVGYLTRYLLMPYGHKSLHQHYNSESKLHRRLLVILQICQFIVTTSDQQFEPEAIVQATIEHIVKKSRRSISKKQSDENLTNQWQQLMQQEQEDKDAFAKRCAMIVQKGKPYFDKVLNKEDFLNLVTRLLKDFDANDQKEFPTVAMQHYIANADGGCSAAFASINIEDYLADNDDEIVSRNQKSLNETFHNANPFQRLDAWLRGLVNIAMAEYFLPTGELKPEIEGPFADSLEIASKQHGKQQVIDHFLLAIIWPIAAYVNEQTTSNLGDQLDINDLMKVKYSNRINCLGIIRYPVLPYLENILTKLIFIANCRTDLESFLGNEIEATGLTLRALLNKVVAMVNAPLVEATEMQAFLSEIATCLTDLNTDACDKEVKKVLDKAKEHLLPWLKDNIAMIQLQVQNREPIYYSTDTSNLIPEGFEQAFKQYKRRQHRRQQTITGYPGLRFLSQSGKEKEQQGLADTEHSLSYTKQ